MIQKAFRDYAMSQKSVESNPHSGLQQAEHLRMLNMYWLQSTKISN